MKKLMLCLAASLGGFGFTAGAQNYELLILSTNDSAAFSLNSAGYTVGYITAGGKTAPYLWSPAMGSMELPPFLGTSTNSRSAVAINDTFVIAGKDGPKAVVWDFNPGITNFVPHLIDDLGTTIYGINRSNVIVGASLSDKLHYTTGFTMDLATGKGFATLQDSYCFAINDAGTATGMSRGVAGLPYLPSCIKRKTDGTYALQSCKSTIPGEGFASGRSINNLNRVVGYNNTRGFYWEPDTGVTFVFGTNTQCYAINDAGIIVGSTNNRACLWTKKADGSFAIVDLNKVSSNTSMILEKAYSINKVGQIVGQCLNPATGTRSAYMLTPASGITLSITKNVGNATVSWNSKVDHLYSIRTSQDLRTWSSSAVPYQADSTNSWIAVSPSLPKLFITVSDLTP